MVWPVKPVLIEGDTVNLKALTPRLAAIIKTCLGKLDRTVLEPLEAEQIQSLYAALSGEDWALVVKGRIGDYGPPIEYILALPPSPKRK
jgi:hypothetical protein